jgi:hypothetical protein
MISYNNDFALMMVVIAALPALLLVRSFAHAEPATAAAHD